MTGLNMAERFIVCGLLTMLAVFIILTALTSGFWMRLDRLQIADVCAGQPVPITYDRTFLRDFHGQWRVAVWELDRGEWQAYAGASGDFDYKAATPRPDRDMEWLTGGYHRASILPPGTFRVDVTITANPGTIFSRTAAVASNPFEVLRCSS